MRHFEARLLRVCAHSFSTGWFRTVYFVRLAYQRLIPRKAYFSVSAVTSTECLIPLQVLEKHQARAQLGYDPISFDSRQLTTFGELYAAAR